MMGCPVLAQFAGYAKPTRFLAVRGLCLLATGLVALPSPAPSGSQIDGCLRTAVDEPQSLSVIGSQTRRAARTTREPGRQGREHLSTFSLPIPCA